MTKHTADTDQKALNRPPESFRPNRPEVMTEFGAGTPLNIQPGVVFEAMVGKHNQARNLTTGIVHFGPGVQLAYHTHPTTESLTLLRGAVTVNVDGRCYQLGQFDNVVVPPGLPHGITNTVTDGETLLHVTFPTDSPSRELVEPSQPTQMMPDDSTGPGKPGLERVNRFKSAARVDAGERATFIDFFNEQLTPGVEMSGGFGLFQPGGRLPAHVHDFDESICIVDGVATCVVEGRRYSMNGYATALEPRGRVHYFVNESTAPMAMIWVYAGPRPERIVVDERNATVVGNPWK